MTPEGDRERTAKQTETGKANREGIVNEDASSHGSADQLLATPNKGSVATAESSRGKDLKCGRPTNLERLRRSKSYNSGSMDFLYKWQQSTSANSSEQGVEDVCNEIRKATKKKNAAER